MADAVFQYAREKLLELAALPSDDLLVYVQWRGKVQALPYSTVFPPDPSAITWNRAGGETVGND
jgi:hypothetical protein